MLCPKQTQPIISPKLSHEETKEPKDGVGKSLTQGGFGLGQSQAATNPNPKLGPKKGTCPSANLSPSSQKVAPHSGWGH